MLSALNASQTLQNHQYRLRKVLKYQMSSTDHSQEQQSPDEEPNQPPVLLIQKILIKATQPSPLKPSFSLEEMQLAALNLSQFLAAEGNLEKASGINNDKQQAKTPTREQCNEITTPNSECSVKSVVSEKSHKKKKTEGQKESSNPMIVQIMEMGFSRKNVENAIKSLGNF